MQLEQPQTTRTTLGEAEDEENLGWVLDLALAAALVLLCGVLMH